MNIKSVITPPIFQTEAKARIEANGRTQNSADRDADGKREQGDHEQKRHLSKQEFDEALRILEDFPGLKSNNLVIKVELEDDHRVILIVDHEGKVVRRLSESQLWSATRDRDKQTGRILDKAM